MQIPSDVKAFNRALVEEFRANQGQLSGPMAGRSLLLLTTTGARSGQPRTTVLAYGKDGDRMVVIASNNGAEREHLAARVPYLDRQQALTKREIPVVVLERMS